MGTENAIMAAVLAKGETIVGHAACEPHIQDLCRFLVSLGARIEGVGSNVLRIEGVERLGGGATDRPRAHRGRELRRACRRHRRRSDDRGRRAGRSHLDRARVSQARDRARGGGVDPARAAGQELPSRTTSAGRSPRSRAASGPPSRPTSRRSPSSRRRRRRGRCWSSRRCSRAGCSSSTSSSRWAPGSSSATRIARSSPGRAAQRGAAREPRHPRRHGDGHRGALRRGHVDDRQHRADRPRLRAHRRAPARPRRRDRARRAVSGARLSAGRGAANVATGVPVLDHLLVELARRAASTWRSRSSRTTPRPRSMPPARRSAVRRAAAARTERTGTA